MMKRSWRNVEEEFLEYYEGEKNSLGSNTQEFLEGINFVEDGKITPIGEQYLDSKFIFENGEHELILRSEVLNLREIRELCQSFYGQGTNRKKVERFLKSKTDIANETEVGRILDLLNAISVVSYSKRNGTVQFAETEQVEDEDQASYRITHRTPYSNIKRLRKALRACEGDLMWVAKHFPKKGFEPLSEEVTGESFTSVRVLCGPANVTHKMRSDFERFRKEMKNRDIEAELRVIINNDHLRNFHDRWLLSDGTSWNIPPINSLYQNQEAEIHKADEDISFDNWWKDAKDIIDDWNDIQGHL